MSPVHPRRPGGVTTVSTPVIVSIVVDRRSCHRDCDSPASRSSARPSPRPPGSSRCRRPPCRFPPTRESSAITCGIRAHTRLAVIYLPPRAVTKEMLLNLGDIIGRVLDGDKQPGYVFTEADFLPRGTREGLVGGHPARQAGHPDLRRQASRVCSASTPAIDSTSWRRCPLTRPSGGRSLNFGGPYSQELALQAQLSNWDKQATVRVIVQSAVIVEPMTTRGVPTYQTSMTEGAATRTRPVQEVGHRDRSRGSRAADGSDGRRREAHEHPAVGPPGRSRQQQDARPAALQSVRGSGLGKRGRSRDESGRFVQGR